MSVQFSRLLSIDNNEEITEKTHYEFIYHLQGAVLLALREQGILNPVQYRYAEENLKQQRRDRTRKIFGKGERK